MNKHTKQLVFVLIFIAVITPFSTMTHEMGHYITFRAAGANASIYLSPPYYPLGGEVHYNGVINDTAKLIGFMAGGLLASTMLFLLWLAGGRKMGFIGTMLVFLSLWQLLYGIFEPVYCFGIISEIVFTVIIALLLIISLPVAMILQARWALKHVYGYWRFRPTERLLYFCFEPVE